MKITCYLRRRFVHSTDFALNNIALRHPSTPQCFHLIVTLWFPSLRFLEEETKIGYLQRKEASFVQNLSAFRQEVRELAS